MRNEIVVGLDDSPSGMAALRWAAAEAIRSHAVLRAVHALSWPFGVEHADGILAGRQLSRAEVDVAYRASITRVFDAIQPRPDWIIQFAHGDPGPVLIRQSEQANALVIGTPSHVGLGRLLIGSVAQYCLSHASCPVVAVPPTLAADVAQNPGPVLDHTTVLASA
jgi:nucleotide-binding universal stress UspA family protein